MTKKKNIPRTEYYSNYMDEVVVRVDENGNHFKKRQAAPDEEIGPCDPCDKAAFGGESFGYFHILESITQQQYEEYGKTWKHNDYGLPERVNMDGGYLEKEITEAALKIARIAHKRQVDLDGYPVLLHPMEVALHGENHKQRIVGLLHDVVEDSDFTFDTLLRMGIPFEYVKTLQLLTHHKEDSYMEYLTKIKNSGDADAIQVKINDLQNNLYRGKRGHHERLIKKHSEGLAYMLGKEQSEANVENIKN